MAAAKKTMPKLPPLQPPGERKARVKKILAALNKAYPRHERTELEHIDPLQMVVATILSAQCTDKQVNKVTPGLFGRYKNAADYAGTDIEELESYIKSTGFYHNKAKNITAMAAAVRNDFDGVVPREISELIKLPGVGRKTANVIKYAVWGDNDGIAVDTHVGRLSRRLGLSREKDPVKVENDLLEAAPPKSRGRLSWLLIQHGRNVCNARKPDCEKCSFAKLCPSAGKADMIK